MADSAKLDCGSSTPEFLPLIIEVRANEGMPRSQASQVPYTPIELAIDASECAAAGASVYHWHGRDSISGATIDDPETFLAAAEAICRENDALVLKPTTGFNRESAVARMAHIVALAERCSGYVDMIPLDNFSANSDAWMPATRSFGSDHSVYINTRGHIMECIEIARGLGLPVSLACPDIGSIRTGICYRDMGLLPGGTLWEIAFSGPSMPLAAAPSITALQAMVAAIPAGDPWSVLCTSGDLLPLCGTIILMGGHISIGLGDHNYARFGELRNVHLVQKVKAIADIIGRPVATPSEARTMLSVGTS